MRRAGFPASAGVGRERETPRSERSEPAALKVQLVEVGKRGEGVWRLRLANAYVDLHRIFGDSNRLLRKLLEQIRLTELWGPLSKEAGNPWFFTLDKKPP